MELKAKCVDIKIEMFTLLVKGKVNGIYVFKLIFFFHKKIIQMNVNLGLRGNETP